MFSEGDKGSANIKMWGSYAYVTPDIGAGGHISI